MPSSRSSKRAESNGTASPTVSRLPDDPRRLLCACWKAWDEEPSNAHRANAYVDACNSYAGHAANQLRHFLAARRRDGMTYREALDAWDSEW